MSALSDALSSREHEYAAAVDRARDRGATAEDGELLREAVELVRCLRRMIPARSVAELHAVFGAPGDFGYENPIGAALARTYWGDRPAAETMAGPVSVRTVPAHQAAEARITETWAGVGHKKAP